MNDTISSIRICTAGATDTERVALKAARNAGLDFAAEADPLVASEGVLLLTDGPTDFRLKKVSDHARKLGKHCLHLNLKKTLPSEAPYEIHGWLEENRVRTLYVTGPDESCSPGIVESTRLVIDGLGMISGTVAAEVSEDEVTAFVDSLPLREKTVIANMDLADLATVRHLFEQFLDAKGYGRGESRQLLAMAWKRLRKSHRIRIVKE